MAVLIEELSLLGLFSRLGEIEQLKESGDDDEASEALVASEPAVKKAIGGFLDAASNGLSEVEKTKAQKFLQAQIKAVDPHDRHAAVRRDKLSQLLDGVGKAPASQDPPHVKRARDAVKSVNKDYKEAHETYEKWERGKMMFKTNDELKAMQKRHSDLAECKEARQAFLEEMLLLKDSATRPPALASSQSSAPKAKAKTTVRAANPAVRVTGGYPAPRATGRSNAPVAADAMRSAQLVAEVRAEAESAWRAEQVEAPKPAKPPRVKCVAEEPDNVVLSFSCTCKAVAQLCGISVEKARDMAESSKDFQRLLSPDQWSEVKERSQAIEKEEKESVKKKEQQKKEKALARVANQQGPALTAAPPAAMARPPGMAPAAPKAVVKAKAAPKTKSAPKRGGGGGGGGLAALVSGNRFGGMEDSDDDDEGGWSTVQR